MDRRTVLSALFGAGLTTWSGCSNRIRSRPVLTPSESVTSTSETALHFTNGDSRLATLTIQPSLRVGHPVPVSLHLWHRSDTTVTQLRYSLRAPPGGHEPPADIGVIIPQWQPAPSVDLRTDRNDLAKIIEIDDLGAQGQSTVSLKCLVAPFSPSTNRLEVRGTASVAESRWFGRPVRLQWQTQVPLTAAADHHDGLSTARSTSRRASGSTP